MPNLTALGTVISMILLALAMFAFGLHQGEQAIKQEAVKSSCARYNPDTGIFEIMYDEPLIKD